MAPSFAKKTLNMFGPKEPEPIRALRNALMNAESHRAGLGELPGALDAILRDRLWETVDGKYASFTEFVFASAPAGLGVTTLPAVKLLRHFLLGGCYYEH